MVPPMESGMDQPSSDVLTILYSVLSGQQHTEGTAINSTESVRSQLPNSCAGVLDVAESLPLDYAVPEKVKTRVSRREPIDFRDLLNVDQDESYTITVNNSADSKVVNLSRKQTHKYPLTIFQWCEAFTIFSYVYLQKFPESNLDLLNYENRIRINRS